MTEENMAPESAPETTTFNIPEEYIQDGKILGKFDSPQALLDAFATGPAPTADAAPAPVEAPAPAADAPALDLQIPQGEPEPSTAITQEDLLGVWREAQENGGALTDARYAEMEARGISRDTIDLTIEGLNSRRQLAAKQIADAVGGEAAIQEAFTWAKSNLTEAQQTSINADLNVASIDGQTAIIQGLIQRAGVTQRTVLGANTPASNSVPFQSKEQLYEAQRDARYEKDPAYRDQVMRRLRASRI